MNLFFYQTGKDFGRAASHRGEICRRLAVCSHWLQVILIPLFTPIVIRIDSFHDHCVLPQGPNGILALSSRSKVPDHLRQP